MLKEGITFAKAGSCAILTSGTNMAQIVGGRLNVTCEYQNDLLPFLRELVNKLEELSNED